MAGSPRCIKHIFQVSHVPIFIGSESERKEKEREGERERHLKQIFFPFQGGTQFVVVLPRGYNWKRSFHMKGAFEKRLSNQIENMCCTAEQWEAYEIGTVLRRRRRRRPRRGRKRLVQILALWGFVLINNFSNSLSPRPPISTMSTVTPSYPSLTHTHTHTVGAPALPYSQPTPSYRCYQWSRHSI